MSQEVFALQQSAANGDFPSSTLYSDFSELFLSLSAPLSLPYMTCS